MKITCQPFDDEVEHSTEVLKCISLDLWGKARTQSQGGAWYMGLIVDQATGTPTPFFTLLKHTEVILDGLKTVLMCAETQTGKKAKVIHIDKGREWDNTLFAEFYAICGLTIEWIPKDSSAANEQVECSNHTIIEGCCMMIKDSSLGKEWWAEAAAAYCYI